MKNPNILRIRDHNSHTPMFKTIEVIYAFVIATLLGGCLIWSGNFGNFFSGQVIVIKDLLPIVFGWFFLAFTFFSFYKKAVVLVVDSFVGEILTFVIALIFLSCCVLTFQTPAYWPIFVVIALAGPWLKNLHMLIRLTRQQRVLNWEEEHPLRKAFKKWFWVSLSQFGLAGFVAILGFLALKSSPRIVNFVLAGLIVGISSNHLRYFAGADKEFTSIEKEVDDFIEALDKAGLDYY